MARQRPPAIMEEDMLASSTKRMHFFLPHSEQAL